MKYLSLVGISLLVLGGVVLGFSLLMPANVVISRARNITANRVRVPEAILNGQIDLENLVRLLNPGQKIVVLTGNQPFYKPWFNHSHQPAEGQADTVFFTFTAPSATPLNGGIAAYQLSDDSTTLQAFYVFQTKWYKPLQKMRLMMADDMVGPGLDSMLIGLQKAVPWEQ